MDLGQVELDQSIEIVNEEVADYIGVVVVGLTIDHLLNQACQLYPFLMLDLELFYPSLQTVDLVDLIFIHGLFVFQLFGGDGGVRVGDFVPVEFGVKGSALEEGTCL